MNQIIRFNQREIIQKMEVIEKLLNDDLRKGLFESPERLLYREEIKKQVVDLFIEHWKDNFGDDITLYRGTKYGSRTKKEKRVDIWKIYPTTINPLIAYKFARMTTGSFNEKQIPIVIEYNFKIEELRNKVDSVPFHFINVGTGFFGLEESEMEFTFKEKPIGSKKNYYKPLIGFRFRKIDNTEMKENKMITNFEIFEGLTQKSEVQMEIDRLMDKGLKNLTPDELSFLKNPVMKKDEPIDEPEKNEIDKYYKIAEDFFNRVVGRDIRNFELTDKLDLWDIFDTEDEVYHAGSTIYYMYGVQIDPENDDDYVLLNIFKKIYHRIQK